MDIPSSILQFLTDKSRKISSKALFILMVIVFLFLIDNIFSFSFYYNNSQKIGQTKEINEILKDSSLSINEKETLFSLRNEIIFHKTLKDISYEYLTNLDFSSDETNTELNQETRRKERDSTIHFITSAWWILIIMIFFVIMLPFIILFDKKAFLSFSLGVILILMTGALLSLLLSKGLSFIPLIWGHPILNYILNFILSSILLSLIIYILVKTQKKADIEKMIKDEVSKKKVFDVIKFDFKNKPDESFELINTETTSSGAKIFTYTAKLQEKVASLFDNLDIITFDNSKSRNFVFYNTNFNVNEINHLKVLINKIYHLYGNDSVKLGIFDKEDLDQLSEKWWIGRSWTQEKFEIPISINYDPEDGLSLTIWVTD